MKREIDPIEFGNRVRERRKELGFSQIALGKETGYSQTNVGWLEQGKAKDPRTQAEDFSRALRTTPEWLLWGTGQREVGPPIMTVEQANKTYDSFSPAERAEMTQAFFQIIEAALQKRKSG